MTMPLMMTLIFLSVNWIDMLNSIWCKKYSSDTRSMMTDPFYSWLSHSLSLWISCCIFHFLMTCCALRFFLHFILLFSIFCRNLSLVGGWYLGQMLGHCLSRYCWSSFQLLSFVYLLQGTFATSFHHIMRDTWFWW